MTIFAELLSAKNVEFSSANSHFILWIPCRIVIPGIIFTKATQSWLELTQSKNLHVHIC